MIHLYQNNGYNIVLDVNSGAVHVVDKAAYDVIGALEEQNEFHTPETLKSPETAAYLKERLGREYAEEDLTDILEAVTELTGQGRLFTRDVYEDYIDEVKQRKTAVKALCLHIAHDCNLACKYCFAEEGEYHGRRALMSYEVGKKALDFLIANSGKRRNLEVDFFGGEPLMNWEVVKKLVAYARQQEPIHNKKFRFTLTTNGMLLNEEVDDFLNKEMHNVVLSLDGRKEIHDRLRRTVGGKGSYDVIVPKFQQLAKSRNEQGYYVRGTFTHYNTDFTNDVFHMADLGFTQLSMEPVVCAPGDPYALTEEDLPGLFDQYEILAKEMIRREKEGRGFTFYHYMLDLSGGPCIYKRITGCGSGTEYLAVTPWGELFPCHQFVGDSRYSMGNVWDGVTNTALRDQFKLCNAYTRKECQSCWARLYCSGGCAANAYHATGSINGVYDYGCQLFRKRIECAIMIQAALAEEKDR